MHFEQLHHFFAVFLRCPSQRRFPVLINRINIRTRINENLPGHCIIVNCRDDKWCVTVRTFCFQWCSAYGHRKPMGTWEVFIKDHHEGYISWAEYERDQALLASNASRFPPL